MITFYHSPNSRSTTILAALDEFGLRDAVDLKLVSIPRVDGSGGVDAANPHPEGKVPYLIADGEGFSERAAILAFLSERFPESGLGPAPGAAERGPFLGWLAYYAGVVETVLILAAAGVEHPWLTAAIRGPKEVAARLHEALADGRPWLLKSGFSAADMLLYSPFGYFPEALPDDPLIRAWASRVAARPGFARAQAFDAQAVALAA